MKVAMVYLMYDGSLYKIGKSVNPQSRLIQLRSGNPKIKLIWCGYGITENELHYLYCHKRVDLEWFNLDEDDVAEIKRLIVYFNSPIEIIDGVIFCNGQKYVSNDDTRFSKIKKSKKKNSKKEVMLNFNII